MDHSPQERIEVFYSYARKDEEFRDELARQLDGLQRQELITGWHDRQIVPGTKWSDTIDSRINTASIILLLISPNFMASRYCTTVEMQRALERHHAGEARVIPIILSPLDWHNEPFAQLQALPTDGKPVSEWENRGKAFLDIRRGIGKAIEEWQQVLIILQDFMRLKDTINRRSRCISVPSLSQKIAPMENIPISVLILTTLQVFITNGKNTNRPSNTTFELLQLRNRHSETITRVW